jgi:hypothetical protein
LYGEVGLGEVVNRFALGVGDVDVDDHFAGVDADRGRGWRRGGRGLGGEIWAAEGDGAEDQGRGGEGQLANAH